MKTRLGLQARLVALILGLALPMFLISIIVNSVFASNAMTTQAETLLQTINQDLVASTNTWLDLNSGSLRQLTLSKDIISLDPAKQKPVLQAIILAQPDVYLASTTNSSGFNTARSDSALLTDYNTQQWYLSARAGAAFSYQTLIENSIPTLIISAPFRNEGNSIIGTSMFAVDLTNLSSKLNIGMIGENGFSYIVDGKNHVIAHPDPAYVRELRNLSDMQAVKLMRSGETGLIRFDDEQGQEWMGYVQQLDNGWGVLVQIPTREILAPSYQMQTNGFLVMGIGAILLAFIIFTTASRVIGPIKALTNTAAAISAGDLDQRVEVTSADEIGTLATAFNSMTNRLRTTLYDLQVGIEQRTAQLERTLSQLRAGSEISRTINTILDVPTLLTSVVNEVQEKFDLYYAGVFLMDANGEYAVLRAGTGEAGEKMVAQGHKLLRGGSSMIGWVTTRLEPRIALDVGTESVRFNNPLLPLTRSEMAVPVVSRGKVLGALSIQSTKPSAFNDNDILVIQSIADNLAISLENANLFQQTQQNLDEIRNLNQAISRTAWSETLDLEKELVGSFSSTGIATTELQDRAVNLPLTLRDETIGEILIDIGDHQLTSEEKELVESITIQTALALENARLLAETQRNAFQEQKLNDMTAQFTRAISVEDVLKTAVRELTGLPSVAEVSIQITSADEAAPSNNGHKEQES